MRAGSALPRRDLGFAEREHQPVRPVEECGAADHVDEIVLASGDGDFDMLLDRIISKHGVEAVAYGVPGLTANSLIRAASRYVPIEGALLLK